MKKIMMILAAAALLAVPACDKYDDGRPAKGVREEFASMYPDAKDVEWDDEGAYWKVSFETGAASRRVDHEAWYDKSGNWVRTETDMLLANVPQKIKDYLDASEYGSAVLSDNDIDFVETPEGNYYRFEIVLNGLEVYVNVSEEGDVSLGGLDW